jgi:hypothetical protein
MKSSQNAARETPASMLNFRRALRLVLTVLNIVERDAAADQRNRRYGE